MDCNQARYTVEGYMVCVIISENTIMYEAHFTEFHTHTNRRSPENPGTQHSVICLCCWCSGLKRWQ